MSTDNPVALPLTWDLLVNRYGTVVRELHDAELAFREDSTPSTLAAFLETRQRYLAATHAVERVVREADAFG